MRAGTALQVAWDGRRDRERSNEPLLSLSAVERYAPV